MRSRHCSPRKTSWSMPAVISCAIRMTTSRSPPVRCCSRWRVRSPKRGPPMCRSEEHTSELQSHVNLVCRLLLEKKKNKKTRQLKDRGKTTRGSRRTTGTVDDRFCEKHDSRPQPRY